MHKGDLKSLDPHTLDETTANAHLALCRPFFFASAAVIRAHSGHGQTKKRHDSHVIPA